MASFVVVVAIVVCLLMISSLLTKVLRETRAAQAKEKDRERKNKLQEKIGDWWDAEKARRQKVVKDLGLKADPTVVYSRVNPEPDDSKDGVSVLTAKVIAWPVDLRLRH